METNGLFCLLQTFLQSTSNCSVSWSFTLWTSITDHTIAGILRILACSPSCYSLTTWATNCVWFLAQKHEPLLLCDWRAFYQGRGYTNKDSHLDSSLLYKTDQCSRSSHFCALFPSLVVKVGFGWCVRFISFSTWPVPNGAKWCQMVANGGQTVPNVAKWWYIYKYIYIYICTHTRTYVYTYIIYIYICCRCGKSSGISLLLSQFQNLKQFKVVFCWWCWLWSWHQCW